MGRSFWARRDMGDLLTKSVSRRTLSLPSIEFRPCDRLSGNFVRGAKPCNAIEILRPALLLAGWTLVITTWMFVTRSPGDGEVEDRPAVRARTRRSLRESAAARRCSASRNNYNHLFEQPTLYYAVVLMIAAIGAVDDLHVAVFLGLRGAARRSIPVCRRRSTSCRSVSGSS